MNKGGGKGGKLGKEGEEEGYCIHADVPRKEKENDALRMLRTTTAHIQKTLETTDLCWDGISHLKTQNTPNVKPRKHTRAHFTHLHQTLCWLKPIAANV